MAALSEFGPARLTDEQIALNARLVMHGVAQTYNFRGSERYFTPWGTLKIKQKVDLRNPKVRSDRFWCGELLSRDPDSDRLKTSPKGAIWVFDNNDTLQWTIWPDNIRLVRKEFCYKGVVHEGGFLLRAGKFNLGDMTMTSEEYARILREAEQGNYPEAYTKSPYMKINTEDFPLGSELDVVFFDPGRNKPWWNMDGVVIAADRTLVPRTITHPLNPYHGVEQLPVDPSGQASVPLSST